MAKKARRLLRNPGEVAEFLQTETSGGLVLVLAAVAALLWANFLGQYEAFWHTDVGIGPLTNDLRHWVNDGLMTLFFFVVGLEIKRELVVGELRELRVAALPIAAAVGGMAVPAGIYLGFNPSGPAQSGWGIPMATDIAFALGMLTLLGRRAPSGLRLFLLTVAIVDDVGAIAVIAVFYSSDTRVLWLGAAVGIMAAIVVLRAMRVTQVVAYMLPAVALWYATWRSGVHPTIAGVALGLLTPARPVKGRDLMDYLDDRMHPVSSFFVVPVFALANAGLILSFETIREGLASRAFWGVATGLLVGKTTGIFGTAWLCRALGLGRFPRGVDSRDLIGVAALAGIGFTVSLFITDVGLPSDDLVAQAKMGVLIGSVASAVAGSAILLWRFRVRSR